MAEYRIYLNDELQCSTTSQPLAQAAWHRSSRDRKTAENAGLVRMQVGNTLVAEMHPEADAGQPWPDGREHQVNLNDVLDSLLLLLQHDGWNHAALAKAQSDYGLKTDAQQIAALQQTERNRRPAISVAEVKVLIDAVLAEKQRG
ncbi:hypothetical protein [Phytopseudomonas dryadis]|uniref:Uncharacterized protein n=1 Tax=Phytopseudomonas dryadis TaxID=2487520 RepID=A0ABY1ZBY4_9GAMM|nr:MULTISPECIES: hypothetical protein [Pseudomonas]TBV09381.1 hypothetical protein DNK34_02265 [Pseudomonas dryadis]TBV18769.1 hypothetical protein DNK41_07005 [Pseudomonas sp. FRB 230]